MNCVVYKHLPAYYPVGRKKYIREEELVMKNRKNNLIMLNKKFCVIMSILVMIFAFELCGCNIGRSEIIELTTEIETVLEITTTTEKVTEETNTLTAMTSEVVRETTTEIVTETETQYRKI